MDHQHPTGPSSASTVKNSSQRGLCPGNFTAGINVDLPSVLVILVISDTST